MLIKKKIIAISILSALVFGGVAAITAPKNSAKNLKVLPKDISDEKLDSIMNSYNIALGVKCNFCHAQSTTDPSKLDFASDENKHKNIARGMMKMTKRINKKFFKDDPKGAVTCYTCHNGSEEPKAPPVEKLDD